MNIYAYIILLLVTILLAASFCIYILQKKIEFFELKLMLLFSRRCDMFPALYEISRESLTRHKEIFAEALLLRKQEFWLMASRRKIEGYLELQSHIHHEINFIFQVCNKNPYLLKNKKFLYLRDTMVAISTDISQEMKKYKRIIEIYNKIIYYKNCTLIWILIPFKKKPTP